MYSEWGNAFAPSAIWERRSHHPFQRCLPWRELPSIKQTPGVRKVLTWKTGKYWAWQHGWWPLYIRWPWRLWSDPWTPPLYRGGRGLPIWRCAVPNLVEIPVPLPSLPSTTNATSAGTQGKRTKRKQVIYLSNSSVPRTRPLSADLLCHCLILNFVQIICETKKQNDLPDWCHRGSAEGSLWKIV